MVRIGDRYDHKRNQLKDSYALIYEIIVVIYVMMMMFERSDNLCQIYAMILSSIECVYDHEISSNLQLL